MCVCGGGRGIGEWEVGGGWVQKLALSLLVLREFTGRQNFAYFFHLHYVRVEKLQVKVNYPSALKSNS